MNNHFTALLDANVLYPAPIRDILLQLAFKGLYRAKWTNEIHDEWISNLLKNRTDLTIEQLSRTRNAMNESVLDSLVTNYEPIIDGLHLPDSNDRHVLAAAIKCQAQIIVTSNVKDFPQNILDSYSIEAINPDEFLRLQADLFQPQFLSAIKDVRSRLKKPLISPNDYLINLGSIGLIQTASFLSDYVEVI